MSSPVAFAPRWAGQSIAVTSNSGSATLNFVANQNAVRFHNAGLYTCFIRVTKGADTAVMTDLPLPSGAVEVFTKGDADDTVSAVCATGQTTTLYINQGVGQ